MGFQQARTGRCMTDLVQEAIVSIQRSLEELEQYGIRLFPGQVLGHIEICLSHLSLDDYEVIVDARGAWQSVLVRYQIQGRWRTIRTVVPNLEVNLEKVNWRKEGF